MRFLAIAVAAALVAGAMSTANAQSAPRRTYAQNPPGTVVTTRDETGRVRTKVLVQKRSYLDGGTEVMPGDNIDSRRSSFGYTGQMPTSVISNDNIVPSRPITDPFFLPGKDNPYFR